MMQTATYQNRSDLSVDFFLSAALVVFGLNLVSQAFALPFQLILLVYAATRFDVRYIPAIFVLLLDKSSFPFFDAELLKFNIVFSLSAPYLFLIFLFFISWIALFLDKFDSKTKFLFPLWTIALIFAFIISFSAREKVTFWQNPLSLALSISYYFWGILLGKSWELGKEYFCKRLLFVLSPLSFLWTLGFYRINAFSLQVMVVCLTLACLYVSSLRKWLLWALPGCFCAFYYIFWEPSTEVADSQNNGEGLVTTLSTFNTVFTVLFGAFFAYIFLTKSRFRRALRWVPFVSLCLGTLLLFYSVVRYRANLGKDTETQYFTIGERFEAKLIADRGAVWSQGLDDMFTPPYVFKKQEDRLEARSNGEVAMQCESHNQYISLIVSDGWVLGNILAFFLLAFFFKSFKICCIPSSDSLIGGVLLSSMGGIYITIGLTGQSLISTSFCGNAIATLAFPGIIYGVYCERRTGAINKSMSNRQGLYPADLVRY